MSELTSLFYDDENRYDKSRGPGNYRLEHHIDSDGVNSNADTDNWLEKPKTNSQYRFDNSRDHIYDRNIILQKTGVRWINKAPIDVESELKNLSRPLTNDISKQYSPESNSANWEYEEDKTEKKFVTNIQNRMENPTSNLRGTGINRWEWLCTDPQANVFIPFRHNLNTKIAMKDVYHQVNSNNTCTKENI